MKSYSSREIIQKMKKNGWYEVRCIGDHHQFRHPAIPGLATVTHPVKDMPAGILKRLQQQTGISFS